MKEIMMNTYPIVGFAWNASIGVPLLVVGLIVLGALWLFGQPRKEQGRRKPQPERGGERRDPVLGEGEIDPDFPGDRDPVISAAPSQGELDVDMRAELERLGAALAGERNENAPPVAAGRDTQRTEPSFGAAPAAHAPAPPTATAPAPAPAAAPAAPAVAPRSDVGRRPGSLQVERIVSLYVIARDEGRFIGSDLVVAAEKAGLEYGDMGIYHRLLDGKRELGPIFSVANLVKPGNFDLSRVDAMRTPGLSFFMTLPGPVSALDAWDAMLPTAQRLAELLDGVVLDEERNALGRQRISHIRDELRGWDRGHEGEEIKFGQ
jgi:cell division protein ZipA